MYVGLIEYVIYNDLCCILIVSVMLCVGSYCQ